MLPIWIVVCKKTSNKFKITYEVEEKAKTNITQKFLRDALFQYYHKTFFGKLSEDRCNEKAEELFQFILNLRDIKEISSLKKISL